jgi:hypothetical protein
LQIDKLDEEILYQTSLPAGLGSDVGLDRGILGTTYVVKFNRGNKILMIEPNYSYRAVSGDLAEKRAVEQSAQSTIWDLPSQQKVMECEWRQLIFYYVMHCKFQQPCKTANKAVTLLMQHEVQCICSVPKTPLNTEFETTVTFVNRDGKPGNYVTVTRYTSHYADAPLFVQLPDNNFKTRLYDVALHTLPILILIIVHHSNPFKKLY